MLGFTSLAATPLAANSATLLSALASTEAADFVAVDVSITATIEFAVTEAQDTASFIAVGGDIAVYLAATEAQDTASILVTFVTEMNLAVTDAPDVAAATVNIEGYGYLEATEATDTASFTANNQNIYFDLTEAPDVAAFAINMSGTMAMAATETPDSYAQNAYILWLEPDQPDDPTIWVPKNDPAPYLTTVI